MAKTFMIHGDGEPPVAVEPMRDPNPFHHAAALVAKLDNLELRALRLLIDEREQELEKNVTVLKPRVLPTSLRWLSRDGGGFMADGKRGRYLIQPFMKDGKKAFMLAIIWNDDRTMTHIQTWVDGEQLKLVAERHNEKQVAR